MEKTLDYLMTSDFNEGLKNDELIELLCRFRNEYRILNSKIDVLKEKNKILIHDNNNLGSLLEERTSSLSKKIAEMEDEMHNLKTRLNKKLSFKERVFGKLY